MKFCTNCGKEIPENVKFCPECGTTADGNDTSAKIENQDQAQKDLKLHDKLHDDLDALLWWGSRNVLSSGVGEMLPMGTAIFSIIFFLLNPLWLASSIFFSVSGQKKLGNGDNDGASRAIKTCRAVNWILILIGLAVWSTGAPVNWLNHLSKLILQTV